MYPDVVLSQAMDEVLSQIGFLNYSQFSRTVELIVQGVKFPFAMRTKNMRTDKMDFWINRTFINIKKTPTYTFDGKDYDKLKLLMSEQFYDYLSDYCRMELKDEAQFWAFTGTYTNKQQLDMTRLSSSEIENLKLMGETNPDNLVMFQFKKKTSNPEETRIRSLLYEIKQLKVQNTQLHEEKAQLEKENSQLRAVIGAITLGHV